jgi:6,7-dimethyl-8-ribityllumazine synthase
LESVLEGTTARKGLASTFDRRGEAERTEVTWVGVSGSWRYALPGLREAVHKEVAAVLAAGKSVVTGGALGTDYWATEVALGINPARLKVILPTSLVTYAAHYRRRAAEGVISARKAEDLIRQLEAVAWAGGLVEHPERPQVVNVTTYSRRNQDVVDAADELLAFQVNASAGTQDTVDRARLKGIPVAVFTFETASDPRPSADA